MEQLHIGNHLSSSQGYLAMGQEALSLDADTFAFFTRNPRGGKAKDIDPEDVKTKTQNLLEVSMKLGQAMYEAQQAEGGAGDGAAKDDDGVVDADYEDISDDKKKSA